jgi:hypothetical protein
MSAIAVVLGLRGGSSKMMAEARFNFGDGANLSRGMEEETVDFTSLSIVRETPMDRTGHVDPGAAALHVEDGGIVDVIITIVIAAV